MSEQLEINSSVGHSWYATYRDSVGSEIIVLEVRHTPKKGFLLHTKIRGTEYHFFEMKFMNILQVLIENLPPDASLTLSHQLLLHQNGADRVVQLDECIQGYRTGKNVDAGYQFALTVDGQTYATTLTPDASFALDELVSQIGENVYFKICGFCDYMYEDGMYGGTDDRHDLMYCFRDHPDVLNKIRSMMRKTPSFPMTLFDIALQDVDLLHSCSAFHLARNYDERIRRVGVSSGFY